MPHESNEPFEPHTGVCGVFCCLLGYLIPPDNWTSQVACVLTFSGCSCLVFGCPMSSYCFSQWHDHIWLRICLIHSFPQWLHISYWRRHISVCLSYINEGIGTHLDSLLGDYHFYCPLNAWVLDQFQVSTRRVQASRDVKINISKRYFYQSFLILLCFFISYIFSFFFPSPPTLSSPHVSCVFFFSLTRHLLYPTFFLPSEVPFLTTEMMKGL